MQTELIKALMNFEFYEANKARVKLGIFSDDNSRVYQTIKAAHEKYGHDLVASDVSALWAVQNQTATNAEAETFQDALSEIDRSVPISPTIARDVVQDLWEQESFREIAQLSLDASSGLKEVTSKIYAAIDKVKEGIMVDDDLGDPVTDDIDELLASASDASRWPFNLESLHRCVYGIGPTEFLVAFARPETGKSSFAVSLCAGPNGFCQQGAKVLYLGNEESVKRIKLRAISAFTGFSVQQIEEDPQAASGMYAAIKDNFIAKDTQEWNFDMVDRYITRFKPDIVVIDQMDKVGIDGSYNSSHEKLREIYRSAREMAKRHEVALIAISQASADAEGKTRLSFDMLENSKTGKAAEADVIIGIGKAAQLDGAEPDMMRFLNISKNKLNGYHGVIPCQLQPCGRYVV